MVHCCRQLVGNQWSLKTALDLVVAYRSNVPMIFNFGSINIDHVYRVATLPKPGETLIAKSVEDHLGGKGINQSIAISKAGGEVCHIGAVGEDGNWALAQIGKNGVGTGEIAMIDGKTGQAIINVDDSGENEIVVFSGANARLSLEQINTALAQAGPQDWVLLQNETNLALQIVSTAKARGCRLVYSAAPFVAETVLKLLDQTDLLVVNEGEAAALAEMLDTSPDAIPVPELIVTRGSNGASYRGPHGEIEQSAFAVTAVDTTGAGDTFLGSFLALYAGGQCAANALEYAAAASALQVTRHGAANAIPVNDEVIEFLEKNR